MSLKIEGCSCARCKAYLFSEDDIVYCPVCGAPHHRECYNALGHCALEELHGTENEYSMEKELEALQKVQEKAEEKSGLASAYIKAVAAGDSAALLRWCSQNEGMDNAAATAFAEETRQLLADMLCGREKTRGLEPAEMMHLCTLMDKCSEYLRFNVGVKHIFGLLAVESIAGSRNRG